MNSEKSPRLQEIFRAQTQGGKQRATRDDRPADAERHLGESLERHAGVEEQKGDPGHKTDQHIGAPTGEAKQNLGNQTPHLAAPVTGR